MCIRDRVYHSAAERIAHAATAAKTMATMTLPLIPRCIMSTSPPFAAVGPVEELATVIVWVEGTASDMAGPVSSDVSTPGFDGDCTDTIVDVIAGKMRVVSVSISVLHGDV